MKKALIAFFVFAGSYAFVLFLFRNDPDFNNINMQIGLGAVLGVFYITFCIPPVTDLIERYAKATRWTAIGVGISAFGLLIAEAIIDAGAGRASGDVVNVPLFYIGMASFALAYIPGRLPALRRAQTAERERVEKAKTAPTFNSPSSGWAANIFVLRRFGPFLRLCAGWAAIIWVGTNLGLYTAAVLNAGRLLRPEEVANAINAPVLVLGGVLPFQFLLAVGVPTALVAWHRYVGEGTIPRTLLPLPGKSTLGYLWRLWMVLIAFGAVAKIADQNGPDLARILQPLPPDQVTLAVFGAIILLEVLVGSSLALVLPAVALGKRDFRASDSAILVRPQRFAFAAGFIFSLAPFAALAASILAFVHIKAWPLVSFEIRSAGFLLAGFLSLTSCATYLSKAYAALLAQRTNPA